RRRAAGRHRCGAGQGPVLVDERAPLVAAVTGYPATGLSASPAHRRCIGTQAVEIDASHRVARIARARRHACGYSQHRRLVWATSVILLGVVENVSVTSAAIACHAG